MFRSTYLLINTAKTGSARAASVFRRFMLSLLALVLPAAAIAVSPSELPQWMKGEEVKPLGKGTEHDPYLIASAENLFWIAVNIAKTENGQLVRKSHFLQTGDIDLQGKEWVPIGDIDGNTFAGHYNGNGHKITGLVLDWGRPQRLSAALPDTNANARYNKPNAFGLFGRFSGTVENLVIDGARFIQTVPDESNPFGQDVTIGVLAGIVGTADNGTTIPLIRNVIIRNSSITDCGEGANRFMATAWMIGGLIGDLHGAGLADTSGSDAEYDFSDIYVGVDINIPHTILNPGRSWSSKGHQYYVGGIIGRMRSINIARQLPKNMMYCGTIDAPLALTAPIFGGARDQNAATTSYAGFQNTFAGDFTDKAKGSATAEDFASLYYTDCFIRNYDPADSVYERITDDNTESHLVDNDMNTRTFRKQATITINDANRPDKRKMSMFNGVNRGTYTGDLPGTVATFNHDGYTWDFSGANRRMVADQRTRITITAADRFSVRATYTTNRPANTGYSLKWYRVENNAQKELVASDDVYITESENSSTILSFFNNETLFVYLMDGDEFVESEHIHIDNHLDLVTELTDNGFPTPYSLSAALTSNGNPIPSNYVNIKIELLKKSNSELVKTWTAPGSSTIDITVPITEFATKLRVSVEAVRADLPGAITKEIDVPNYLKILKSVTSNRNEGERLPLVARVSFTDKDNNPIEINGVNYTWSVLNYQNAIDRTVQTGPVTSSQTIVLPIYMSSDSKYLVMRAAHEYFATDIQVVPKTALTGYITPSTFTMTNTTQPTDTKLTSRTVIVDNWNGGQPVDSLYGLTYSFVLKDSEKNSYNQLNDIVEHRIDMVGTNTFDFTFPYAYFKDLYFLMPMSDQYGHSLANSGKFSNFNFKTVPTLEAVDGTPGAYRVVLTAAGAEHNVAEGITFNWRIINKPTGKELILENQVDIDPSGRVATLKFETSYLRILECTVTDYYGNEVVLRQELPRAALSAVREGNTVRLDYEGSATLPAQYTVTDVLITDREANDFDITHLQSGISADKTSIVIDDAVAWRVVTFVVNNSEGIPARISLNIPSLPYDIVDEDGEYKARIDNTTDLSGFTGFTYKWIVQYDGGNTQEITGSAINKATGLTYPGFNATVILQITDRYSTVSTSVRRITDNRELTVTRTDDSLVATINGTVPTGGTWQWYGVSGDYVPGTTGYDLGCNSNTLVIDRTNNQYSNYMAVWTADDNTTRLTGYYSTSSIIYVFDKARSLEDGAYSRICSTYPDGDDINSGRTPYTPVKTMERAYALLNNSLDPTDNMIVVMGHLYDENYLDMTGKYLPNGKYNKNTTITGRYGGITEQGALYLGARKSTNSSDNMRGLGGATIFDDIIWDGYGSRKNGAGITSAASALFLYCNLHDLTIGNNVKIRNYETTGSNETGLGDYTAPSITIVGAFHNSDNDHFTYPESNKTKDRTTIKIQSGCFGRVIAGARNNYGTGAGTSEANRYNHKSFNTFGHPQWPHRVDVEIAIKHIKGMEDYVLGTTQYKYDIGLLVGGVTDGSIYTDARLYMSNGSVGRFIAGNISYGRPVGDSHPADAFFGSTELTLDNGVIGELVGGTLGRNEKKDLTTPTCDAFFYGRSIININGGVISGNVYGAGAGGVVGVGTDEFHTMDKLIPYRTGNQVDGWDEILYGPYATAKGNLPKIKIFNNDNNLDIDPADGSHTILDFNKSYTEVNINGGRIEGNVYGGAYGYSKQVKRANALPQAGNVYGNTRVTMTGGVVMKNIYGGGAGAKEYFIDAKNNKVDTIPYMSLAHVYGDTNVEINGGIVVGNVYAGGQGIEGLPDMAKVTGKTNLTVTQVRESENTWRIPMINGSIYAGSQLSPIKGETNVTVSGGAIGNIIFGGSEGTANSMAVVTGNTNVTITDGSFFTQENCDKMAQYTDEDTGGANRMFNIYGGGNVNCVVDGDTHVTITKSLFSSFRNLLERDIYPEFSDCMADDTYRKFSVYGAGRGSLTDVTGDTYLTIDIQEGASVPASKPVDVANNQQFVMISGGGFSGNVYGNTNVLLKGNVFGRRAFGGGMYGRVEGESRINIMGGAYHQVYGGGLLGDVMKGSDLTFGVKATPGNEAQAAACNRNIYVYGSVYGGNDVSGIVGYERSAIPWKSAKGNQFNIRVYNDGEVTSYPYTYHMGSEEYGVNMKIYGGTILGSVFGAGNGNHTGYYVPNAAVSERHDAGFLRVRYSEGPAYLYHLDKSDPNYVDRDMIYNPTDRFNWGLYRYRPRTNRVRMHIGGNSETDRVRIGESVYGGGHACTVGIFDPEKDVLTDPSRFFGGGTVKMNFGSHVSVAQGVYMGNRGTIVGKQTVSDGLTNSVKLIESDYDYHYYDPETNSYVLGFPNSIEGRNRFHAYLRLIDMDAKTSLSFFDDPYDTSSALKEFRSFDPANPTPESLASQDIRFGGFYAGGARGSMTYNAPGNDVCYHYVLPEGLTIENRVVGGSDDAIVNFYRYHDNYMVYDTNDPLFTYYGGIVYDVNDGGVTGYGGGVVTWHGAPEGTPEDELVIGEETPRGERVVVRLDVRCQFDPQPGQYTDENGEVFDTRYGGNVYGGCYNSGITNGSVEVRCTNNLLGTYYESDDFHDYLAWSSLRNNIGRVYGGGFGSNSSVRGRTNVILDGNFRGFNVFGGGMKGNVSRGTNITVKGLAIVYNAIYGGGMHGSIGLDPITGIVHDRNIGTNIRLISGGIDRVYGGGFMGDVHGGTHITISDEGQPEGTPRLLVGSVFGGNDVSGVVEEDPDTHFCTDITVSEEPRADKASYPLSSESTTEPGKYFGGYPMIGNIYGAGNGNMADYISGVTIDREHHEYNGGLIHIATGTLADINIWDLGSLRPRIPDVESARVKVRGGTIINLYGGGSMCTVTGRTMVDINYTDTIATAAWKTGNSDPMTWGTLRLFDTMQQEELTEDLGGNARFTHQIYRVFGGNNLMDMDIQPGWNLVRGKIFSLYSGGNFGHMTYPDGLSLTIDAPDIRLTSVYGGGRVGNIEARNAVGDRIVFPEGKYGATLNIKNGLIGDVYGGNNVAGTVYNGTNVNISGAISGNIYGSGNGNYIYLYDYDGSHAVPGSEDRIAEGFDKAFGGRYFILPPKEAYSGKYYGNGDVEKIVAINSYRPNVEKVFLNIEGREDRTVYVLGNVFCGGNSSTVLSNPDKLPGTGDIKFRIGSHVVLGGVFLGSNGEGLANPYRIANLANLNDIRSMAAENDIASRDGLGPEYKSRLHFRDQGAYDTSLYPNLLSLYMRAAEVTALPDEFILPEDAVESYIGNFTVGGNYGSHMSDETINLELPANLTIMGRIVGGCYNSRLVYHEAVANGGMTKPLKTGLTDRLNLKVRSRFRPWKMEFDPAALKVNLVNNRTDYDGNYVADADVQDKTDYYYPEGIGNIFGGCFTSGRVLGNINIDLYSDYLGINQPAQSRAESGLQNSVDIGMLMNNIADRRTVLAITGAGYGPETEVIGDTRLRLLPQETGPADATTHPSIATIFGGAHNGLQIGTSHTEVRDGMVISSLYGGSRAALKYGSSEVLVGYPQYYVCDKDGIYTLDRADKISYVSQALQNPDGKFRHPVTDRIYEGYNADHTEVIKQSVMYRKGDMVAANVVSQIVGYKASQTDVVTPIDDISEYFTHHRETPADFTSKWDNIDINIGDNRNMNDVTAEYYGGGGIYGGGFALNSSAMTLSGVNTQLAYTTGNNPDSDEDSASVGFGGNSTIVIGDNPANNAVDADGKILYASAGPDGEAIRDHVAIGTGRYVPVKLNPETGDKIGCYVRVDRGGGNYTFAHQPSGPPDPNETYYRMETDGGIYGDGRRTFVEKFRAVDIEGYGYADHSPQDPKLLNTFQRIDLLSLNDCCLQLQGATDYATNAVDATIYAVARIGELDMNSSLKGDITPSDDDTTIPGNMRLDKPRVRNYMGFFHNVHYIGALKSSTPMDPVAGDPANEGLYRGADGKQVAGKTYRTFKNDMIRRYESLAETDADIVKAQKRLDFKKRNLATAPNMVGINNGYTLKVQNVYTTEATGLEDGILKLEAQDNIYYGPILGVVEVKLLTLAEDEGGGYIYAFNSHSDNPDDPGFLEASGNFVYPEPINVETDNYIVDDCYPNSYYTNPAFKDLEEAHYWYVTGHHYYFNATLTGYTFNGPQIDFRLNNLDNLILLSGLETSKANTIEIESITWEDHFDSDYKSALTTDLDDTADDSRSNYQLFLTIDKNVSNNLDLDHVGHAFVAQIPNGNGPNAYGTDDGVIRTRNNYSDYDLSDPNAPTLGIRLHDTDRNNQDPDFYHNHLEQPEYVVIKIKAKDAEDKDNFYTVKLNIVYLQGPYISGKIVVENCALPGEYIYANTNDVVVEMDENLTVTAKRWYLYPLVKPDENVEIFSWDDTPEGRVDVSQYLMDNISGDVNRIQLPARYYQNGWKLGYSIVVNGQDFPLVNEETGTENATNLLTVHNYHRMSTVAEGIKGMTHRYNTGYPFDLDTSVSAEETLYGFNLDLDLVGGALVYIEDDEDFAIFTKYINFCNQVRRDKDNNVIYHDEDGKQVATLVAEPLPGYNPNGHITGFTNGKTINGYLDWQDVPYRNIKNPSGGQNIRFVLSNDVNVTDECLPITEFRGVLNGLGHTIHFNSSFQGKDFIYTNYGTIREVGFTSTGGKDTSGDYTSVVKNNKGQVVNCYYFNYPENHPEIVIDCSTNDYATLVGVNTTETTEDHKVTYTGVTDNCYQNTNIENADNLEGVRYRATDAFHNGMIAYNLNQQYLKGRYLSRDNGSLLHQLILNPQPGQPSVDYLYNYYRDGEFRFANVRSQEHPEGMRRPDNYGTPNYENYMGNGLSMHIVNEEGSHDDTRWFKVPGAEIVQHDRLGNILYDEQGRPITSDEGYFPIYLWDANGKLADHSDYIFFGQRLSLDSDRQYFPSPVTYDNRVYRAGGYLGSDCDYGFHFNREIVALRPTLTAIDFTGFNDLPDATDPGRSQYKTGWQYHMMNDATHTDATYYELPDDLETHEYIERSERSSLRQLMFYPPALDLPGGERSSYLENIKSFAIDSNSDIKHHDKITKNLLVYTPGIGTGTDQISEDDYNRLFKSLHYTRMQQWGDVEGETPQNNIIGHHLYQLSHEGNTDKHFHVANSLFHLVDEQDFNAPIEFLISDYETAQTDGVSGRAWLLRQPKFYASRPTSSDPDEFTISKDGWESIALPFTCNRVVAVNSGDYIEKYSRGQITHFYGSDEKTGITHHDYWLRGMVETAKDGYADDDVIASADFARPGTSTATEKLFEVRGEGGVDEQRRGDYKYFNNWFYNTYKDVAYNEGHNEYSEPITYEQYCYLTKNAPYIVAYPGKDYYEFDLSGEFYNTSLATTGCRPQEILYEFTIDEIDANNNFDVEDRNMLIPVTDVYDAVRHTVVSGADGTATTHHATFMRIAGDGITDNMYVLNTEKVAANVHGKYIDLPAGSAFINCHDFGITEILPFRTYITVDLPSASPKPGSRFISIGSSRGLLDDADEDDEEFVEPEDPEEPEDEIDDRLDIWVDDNTLVVETSADIQLDIVNMQGQKICVVNAYAGTNRYSGLRPGFYIVGTTKVYIPH